MSTIESLTAYPYVSPAAYQRMRETLVRQGSLLDWTVTEFDLAQRSESAISIIQQISDRTYPIHQPNAQPTSTSTSQLKTDQFVLMGAKTWCLLFTAEAVGSDTDNSLTYRVGLTFDQGAIARFVSCLGKAMGLLETTTPASEKALQPSSESKLGGLKHLLNQKHSAMEPFRHHSLHAHSIGSHSQHQQLRQSRAVSGHQSVTTEEELMAQETFILNWAKQMATASGAEAQRGEEVLQAQVQQSLLLDRVVTQIRHSLDLPDILETTVAQVRTFLNADRLVLYQFDRSMQRSDDSLPLAGQVARLAAHAKSSGRAGHSVVSGNVTYEAKASEDITSVLHFAEEKCFTPSRLQRAKFLSGRPIAVDNVDEQYIQTPCLLKFLQKSQVKSKIIAPVVVNGNLWGLLIAHQCRDYRHWKDSEVVFLQHIAEHLAVAVSQAQLYQQLQQQATTLKSRVAQRTQNLHDALMVAETANVTKGEFLSTMSHELRTPLTYIIGMSATLLRWSFGELSDRQRSYLNTINQSGEQLLDIINSILDLAKVESGQRFLDASEVSLTELFSHALKSYQKLAQSQGVALSLESKLAAGEDLFWADRKRLQQVIANLTENAIKFTPEGGQVSLMVWRETQQVVFQVEDTGIGIAESQRDGLFEKFKQLESPFARQYSGTGIGLAMTKHLVEMHGGTIQVESQVDSGSTFTVCLPVQPKQQHDVSDNISNTFASTKRVILLEQDEESAAIVCNMLTAAGYEAIWLLEPEALAAQLELLKPIMLIADLSLLSLDAGQIKSLQLLITTLDAKVLALLSSDSVPLPMAHHDVLVKPIDPKRLLEKVRQLSPILP